MIFPSLFSIPEQMKRAIFFISAIIIISSFSSQLWALPEGAVARLGISCIMSVPAILVLIDSMV